MDSYLEILTNTREKAIFTEEKRQIKTIFDRGTEVIQKLSKCNTNAMSLCVFLPSWHETDHIEIKMDTERNIFCSVFLY